MFTCGNHLMGEQCHGCSRTDVFDQDECDANRNGHKEGPNDDDGPDEVFTERLFHESEAGDAENSDDADGSVVDADRGEREHVQDARDGQQSGVVVANVPDAREPGSSDRE